MHKISPAAHAAGIADGLGTLPPSFMVMDFSCWKNVLGQKDDLQSWIAKENLTALPLRHGQIFPALHGGMPQPSLGAASGKASQYCSCLPRASQRTSLSSRWQISAASAGDARPDFAVEA